MAVSGVQWQGALLVSATAFDSTVIVFKALEEWGQAASPHGRRGIGILLFQDAALVPLMLAAPLFSGERLDRPFATIASADAQDGGCVCGGAGGSGGCSTLGGAVSKQAAECGFVVLFALIVVASWTLAAHVLGLPTILGAFAAGLTLNGNRLSRQIDAVLLPFR